ncbi:MAG: S9 family peptidase, partial [Planctomycetes bacterium]|nr:S9 family peptidase [Planctomycetota bacterium]
MKITSLLTVMAATIGVAMSALPTQAQSDVQLISRETLFGNPDKASPRISPDGEQLAYLAPVNGVLNVWVSPIDDPAAANPVTHDTGRGIRIYFWAYTNKHILYLQDDAGDENWRLNCVDLTTRGEKALTPASATAPGAEEPHEVTARIQHVSYKFPHEIIVALNDRDPQFHALYRVNIETGERVLLQDNDRFLAFHTDDDYNVRFAARLTSDGGNEMLMPAGEGRWKLFAQISMEDLLTTGPVDFDETGSVLYMIDSRGRDTAALTSINLETGTAKILAADKKADISGDLMLHPTRKHLQAASSTYTRKKWHIIDRTLRDDFEFLANLAGGEMSVISRTLDDTQWIVAFEMDSGPVRYYRYEREARSAHFLFTNRSELEGAALPPMHSQVIRARDRLKLVSYSPL